MKEILREILIGILVVMVFAGIMYGIQLATPDPSTHSDYVTAISIHNSTSTRLETLNMTIVQGTSGYIVLQSNLSCVSAFNCYFAVSSPFTLGVAPEPAMNSNPEYRMVPVNHAMYLVGANVKQEYMGNILLWIQAPDGNYTGALTVSVADS